MNWTEIPITIKLKKYNKELEKQRRLINRCFRIPFKVNVLTWLFKKLLNIFRKEHER